MVGGFTKSGSATFSPSPNTGVTAFADPLAGLTTPAAGASKGSISLSSGSLTIGPGVYTQIQVSGNGTLMMNAGPGGTPGIYIIEGGGFTVTGSGSVTGSNIFIYNTGSNYPNPGGTFGGITLSGNGKLNLSAPTSGPYTGILIFQSRANTRALSLSGNALAGLSGVVYASNALLTLSGNAQLNTSLIVGTLNLSGNVALTQMAGGSDGSGDVLGIANSLLAGNLNLYVNNAGGYLIPDELARIQDAIAAWDALLAPYSVTITQVSDPSQGNMILTADVTSACGGAADGVLGCFDGGSSQITMIAGWNWYAGSDPSQIGPNQYDFETTVLHELGHALGLGGSADATSPMNETLPAGVVRRVVTAIDLNIPESPEGADPERAAGFGEVNEIVVSIPVIQGDGRTLREGDGNDTPQQRREDPFGSALVAALADWSLHQRFTEPVDQEARFVRRRENDEALDHTIADLLFEDVTANGLSGANGGYDGSLPASRASTRRSAVDVGWSGHETRGQAEWAMSFREVTAPVSPSGSFTQSGQEINLASVESIDLLQAAGLVSTFLAVLSPRRDFERESKREPRHDGRRDARS